MSQQTLAEDIRFVRENRSMTAPFCPACRSQSREWLTKNDYQLYKCQLCKHGFIAIDDYTDAEKDGDEFRLQGEDNQVWSDEEYYTRLKRGEKHGGHVDRVSNLVLQYTNGPKNGNWLDIGIGSGFLLSKAKSKGWNVMGVEPGGWGQIAAREKGVEVIQDTLKKDTLDTSFDIITATDVLEHVPNPTEFISIASHHLKHTGRLIMTFPCAESFYGRLLPWQWGMIAPPFHKHYFTRQSIAFFLQRAGLRIVETQRYTSSWPPLLGRYKSSKFIFSNVVDHTLGGDQLLCVAEL